MIQVINVLLGILFWRMRGGPWKEYIGYGRREAFGVGMAVLTVFSYSLYSWWSLLLAPAWYLGSIGGFYQSGDIGMIKGDPKTEFLIMSLRGLVVTLPAAIMSYILDVNLSYVLYIGLSGSAMGLIYGFGYRFGRWVGIKDFHAFSEMLFGAWIGFWLYVPF